MSFCVAGRRDAPDVQGANFKRIAVLHGGVGRRHVVALPAHDFEIVVFTTEAFGELHVSAGVIAVPVRGEDVRDRGRLVAEQLHLCKHLFFVVAIGCCLFVCLCACVHVRVLFFFSSIAVRELMSAENQIEQDQPT